MRRLQIAFVAAVLVICAAAAEYVPANYPFRYTTGASYAASGVITTGQALLVGCEFYNSAGSIQFIYLFDSATVPSDGVGGFDSTHTNGWKVMLQCQATSACAWGMNGPNTPSGGSAVSFTSGIAWANSSTAPTKTIGSANVMGACSYDK